MLPRWFLELQRRRLWMRLLEIENIVTSLKLGHQGHVPVALNHQLKPRVELSSIKKLSPESHAAKHHHSSRTGLLFWSLARLVRPSKP